MKKLMVLALVLGIAGFASAGLSLQKQGDDVAKITSDAATIFGNNYYVVIAQTITDYQIDLTAAGNPTGGSTVGAKELYDDGYDWYFLTFITTDSAKPMLAGDWLIVTAKAGQGDVKMYDASGLELLSGPIGLTVIPEPMTMGLLALGGLFIRRKK